VHYIGGITHRQTPRLTRPCLRRVVCGQVVASAAPRSPGLQLPRLNAQLPPSVVVSAFLPRKLWAVCLSAIGTPRPGANKLPASDARARQTHSASRLRITRVCATSHEPISSAVAMAIGRITCSPLMPTIRSRSPFRHTFRHQPRSRNTRAR
jgi:hypothetical protein